jgi:hypothetical protein
MVDIQEEAIKVTLKGTQISFRVLKALIQTLLENRDKISHGEQSLKKLNLQNKQLESVPITSNDIKALRKELNRYSVDFHIMKDRNSGEHTVFFKGQDVDRVYQGLSNCIKNFDRDTVKKKPIKEVIKEATEKVAEREANKRKSPEKTRDAKATNRGQEL